MQWNTGRSYKLDRARHNKSEEYEVPVNKRKRRFKSGGTLVDDKKAMVLSQIKEVHHHADELAKVLANMDTVDAWVVGKMERATTDLSDITHYLDGTTEYADGGMMAKGGDIGKVKMYYHKTSGGAEYLCSEKVAGTNEGSMKAKFVCRIDGAKNGSEMIIKPAFKNLPMYYHKTRGGAEYLCSDRDDARTNEGSMKSLIVVRIDGAKDGSEMIIKSMEIWDRFSFADGGMMSDEMISQKKVLFYRNKLVQMNVGKDSSALDFAIRIIDSMVDKDDEDYVFLTSLQNNKKVLFYRNKLVQMNVGKNSSALDFAIKLIDMAYDGELKMAKGGEVPNTFDNILLDNGFKKIKTFAGVRFFQKGDIFASVDDNNRIVELTKREGQIIYKGYSVTELMYVVTKQLAKGGEVKSKIKKYQILSPDGFAIEREVPYYTSKNKAMSAFDKWKENYSRQGYYSSVRYGRIDLLDLEDYCQFITL